MNTATDKMQIFMQTSPSPNPYSVTLFKGMINIIDISMRILPVGLNFEICILPAVHILPEALKNIQSATLNLAIITEV